MRNYSFIGLLCLVLSACGIKDGQLQSGDVVSAGTVGIRPFAGLYQSYAAMTGVPVSNTNVKNFFNGAKGRMSLDGNPETISPAMLLATTGMAGVFCQELILRDSGLADGTRLIHNGVNFTKTQAALTPALRVSVLQGYARAFWLRDATDEEIAVLMEAMTESEVGITVSSTEMRILLRVACTIVGSSLETIQH